MKFVEACRFLLDSYLPRYGLEFIYADEENLPDKDGLIEKRPTSVVFAKRGLTVYVSNVMESTLDARLFQMPLMREFHQFPTLYEMDHFSHRLYDIQWQQGIMPIDYVLRYPSWEERIHALIKAMEESAADMLRGDFSRWQAVSASIRASRKKMGLDALGGPVD